MVLRNAVRYLLGCVPGCLSGFLFITYPETMPARIPVFSHYSFVDDNDIVQSDGDDSSSTAIKLQRAVDTWEGGLKVTGGALGPEKSYWYLV